MSEAGWELCEVDAEIRDGIFGWRVEEGHSELLFLGKSAPRERSAPLPAAWLPSGLERAWLRQVHGCEVVEAGAGASGECGEGDALVTVRSGLALEIATADCVPVLFAGSRRIGAAHAGWRGIVAGVVPATLARLDGDGDTGRVAWIGPASGPCCYEVGEEVARAVANASRPDVVLAGPRGRPHLDLQLAVAAQLASAGVTTIRVIRECTACSAERLWSYRRDGRGAGRNLSLIRRSS